LPGKQQGQSNTQLTAPNKKLKSAHLRRAEPQVALLFAGQHLVQRRQQRGRQADGDAQEV
jgi:hypothetical protein